MSNKSPRIPSFTINGIADKIQTLQGILSSYLPWLSYSFGIAERYEKLVDDETHIIPTAFVDNTSDPIDLRPYPYDDYKGYAFWTFEDPGEIQYNNENLNYATRKFALWNYNVSLIVMANCKRIDDAPYNETKANLKNDVLSLLQNNVSINFGLWLTQVYEQDINKIFAPFTIEKPQEILKYPNVGFRFDAIIQFKQTCPINNSYSATTSN